MDNCEKASDVFPGTFLLGSASGYTTFSHTPIDPWPSLQSSFNPFGVLAIFSLRKEESN
ncbi:hypothetical protein HI914_01396 [Erysiphe necator]|nr:hypothetical protein HI914_01396 [Erysiphe necator]